MPRGRKDIYKDSPVYNESQNPYAPDGLNEKVMPLLLHNFELPELDKHDVAEMERRFAWYVRYCAENGLKLGNMSAYNAIGIDRREGEDWVLREPNSPRAVFIKKVRKICSEYRERLMEDGKLNPVVGIFWQKVHDNFRDAVDIQVSTANPLGDQLPAAQLAEKYLSGTTGMIEGEKPEVIAIDLDPAAETAEKAAEKA